VQQRQPRQALSQDFALQTERLGPLPLVNHFIARSGLAELLEQYVPTRDRRCAVAHSRALGVLLRSIVVEREPIYRQAETVHGFAAGLYGLSARQIGRLDDDRLGRALDQLFKADRAALLTAVVVAVARRFEVRFERLHNDSTSISFCGQYRDQRPRFGRTAAAITYGYSKNVVAKNMWRQPVARLPPCRASVHAAHINAGLQPPQELHQRWQATAAQGCWQAWDVEAC
jgi:hypothetical protein